MIRTEIAKLYENAAAYTEGTVKVCGWIRTNRDSKVLGFMELNDGSCHKTLQIVFERDNLANYDEIAKQNVGAALVVKVISLPSTVPLAVVAKALNTYVVCAVNPFTTAEIVVPVADTSLHVDALCVLYLNPCAVIVSVPTVIVPFNVALSCVIDVAAGVATTGGTISGSGSSPPCSASVVKVVVTHADCWSSHIALTSTV